MSLIRTWSRAAHKDMLLIPLTLEYMCRTGIKKSPILSKADVSKKYRTIECGITGEMLLTN